MTLSVVGFLIVLEVWATTTTTGRRSETTESSMNHSISVLSIPGHHYCRRRRRLDGRALIASTILAMHQTEVVRGRNVDCYDEDDDGDYLGDSLRRWRERNGYRREMSSNFRRKK